MRPLIVALLAGAAVAAGTALSSVAAGRARAASTVGRDRRPPHGGHWTSRQTPAATGPRRLVAAFGDRRAFQRSLPLLLESLAAQVRAGEGPRAALLAGAAAAGPPYARDVPRLSQRLEVGMGLGEVVRWWAEERRAPELASLGVVLGPGSTWGGSLAAALDGLAAAATDRRTIAAEARAHASQARASAALLVVAPIGFTAVMGVVDPRTTGFLFSTPLGWATVAVAIALDVAGGWWMWRLTEAVR